MLFEIDAIDDGDSAIADRDLADGWNYDPIAEQAEADRLLCLHVEHQWEGMAA